MAFIPALTDPISRIRFALGDTGDPPLLPGGETAYASLLALNNNDERTTMRQAAGALASFYASQPGTVTLANGLSVTWRERIAQWNLIAEGEINTLPPAPGASTVTSGPRVGIIRAGTDWRPR